MSVPHDDNILMNKKTISFNTVEGTLEGKRIIIIPSACRIILNSVDAHLKLPS